MAEIFIVIPTYNEKENISNLVPAIFAILKNNVKIIIVDDNSPDGTQEAIKDLQNKYPITLIRRPQKLGLGSAYCEGFKLAIEEEAKIIIEMDADFSHSPADLPRLIEQLTTHDMAIGSRKIKGGNISGWGFGRKLMSNGAMLISKILLGLKTKDVTAGFRAYKAEVLKKIDLQSIKSNGYAFQEEILYRVEKLGFRIKEIPVTFQDRNKGRSKLSKKDILEFFLTIFKLSFSSKNKF